MTSVPIRTNPELRPSRLFSSMWKYMKRSSTVILRSFAMYKPMRFFGIVGTVLFAVGLILGIRFIVFLIGGNGDGISSRCCCRLYCSSPAFKPC